MTPSLPEASSPWRTSRTLRRPSAWSRYWSSSIRSTRLVEALLPLSLLRARGRRRCRARRCLAGDPGSTRRPSSTGLDSRLRDHGRPRLVPPRHRDRPEDGQAGRRQGRRRLERPDDARRRRRHDGLRARPGLAIVPHRGGAARRHPRADPRPEGRHGEPRARVPRPRPGELPPVGQRGRGAAPPASRVDDYAAKQATIWREGLESSGIGPERLQALSRCSRRHDLHARLDRRACRST